MGNPQPSESQPPESGPVVRCGQEGPTDINPPQGRDDSSSVAAPSVLADDLRKPLAVVIANLQLLRELVARVQAEAGGDGALFSPEAGVWLTIRMAEAENCLSDAHMAEQQIRELMAPKKPLQQGTRERAPALTKDHLRPARILIVDDDASVARALQRVFRDYDAVVHIGARHALDRIVIGERFDVILSDVAMPSMSGCDLYDEIHRFAPEQASRMVFVTGGLPDERTENALAAIGQPVLTKPFNPMQLRTFIEKFLG